MNHIQKEKITDLINLGYSLEIIIEMTKKIPSLFGLSIDTIKEKKDFYDSIGISDILIKNPMMMIQSVKLSYARYMFYKDNNIEINMDNYLLLFLLQEQFKKRYGKDNKEIVDLYSYQNYLEKNKKRKMV